MAILLLAALFAPAVAGAQDTRPGAQDIRPVAQDVRASPSPDTVVVLLHGLGRTSDSMNEMADSVRQAGYAVFNLGYPSREHGVDELVDSVAVALDDCCADATLHFVTHSLGGILVRAYALEPDGARVGRVGRVVMLSPPNHGSEVADRLADVPLLRWVLGPAMGELVTGDGLPSTLGEPAFELGIITGDASLNPLFSWWIPGPDDGKVSVASARLPGADDFLVVPYTHTFIMQRAEVIRQVLAFLESGSFRD